MKGAYESKLNGVFSPRDVFEVKTALCGTGATPQELADATRHGLELDATNLTSFLTRLDDSAAGGSSEPMWVPPVPMDYQRLATKMVQTYAGGSRANDESSQVSCACPLFD